MTKTDVSKQNVPAITYIKKMRNYDKDPFFVKKKQDAIEFIKKNGLPNSVKEKMKEANQTRKQKIPHHLMRAFLFLSLPRCCVEWNYKVYKSATQPMPHR